MSQVALVIAYIGAPARIRTRPRRSFSDARRHSPRRRFLVACLASMLLASAGCQESETRAGTALAEGNKQYYTQPIRTGQQFGLMVGFLRNVAGDPITVRAVAFGGAVGITRVLQVTDTYIAPLPRKPGATDFTPGGLWRTFPPAMRLPGQSRCNVQRLEPVDGFVLEPDAEARVLILFDPVRPGRFRFDSHVITYELDGQTFRQALTVGMRGTVSDSNPGVSLSDSQRACLHHTTLLPSWVAR